MPPKGKKCLFYRPLAGNSGDQVISVKTAIEGNGFCWSETIPKGCEPTNPTDGSCHVTHWMPLPEPPEQEND